MGDHSREGCTGSCVEMTGGPAAPGAGYGQGGIGVPSTLAKHRTIDLHHVNLRRARDPEPRSLRLQRDRRRQAAPRDRSRLPTRVDPPLGYERPRADGRAASARKTSPRNPPRPASTSRADARAGLPSYSPRCRSATARRRACPGGRRPDSLRRRKTRPSCPPSPSHHRRTRRSPPPTAPAARPPADPAAPRRAPPRADRRKFTTCTGCHTHPALKSHRPFGLTARPD